MQMFGMELKQNKSNKWWRVWLWKKLHENNSNDDLPLNKRLKFHLIIIIIMYVFREDGKLYPQLFLDDTFYELV